MTYVGRTIQVFSVFAIVGLTLMLASPAVADDAAAGKEVFMAAKCNMCHSVSSAGIEAKMKTGKMAGGDLTGATAKHDDEWLMSFIKGEEKDGTKHAKPFTGSDEDVQKLIAWLKTQTGE